MREEAPSAVGAWDLRGVVAKGNERNQVLGPIESSMKSPGCSECMCAPWGMGRCLRVGQAPWSSSV